MVYAQDVYHTFLEEGKVWTYHYHGYSGREFNVGRVIDGDTIISGLAYKKIYDKVGAQYQYSLREDGNKVFIVYPRNETESLLYDFGKDVGDCLFLRETGDAHGTIMGWKVANVDTIDIKGVRFRRMQLIEYNFKEAELIGDAPWNRVYWIEGVGSECLLESSFREPGNDYNLLSCQINGRFYTLHELLASGIDEVKTVRSKLIVQNSFVFNLQGQRINGLQKGLNIVDGKKIWVK